MLIPSHAHNHSVTYTSLSRRVNANSQHLEASHPGIGKLIKKGEC